jgi:hypothetical protein
MSWMGRILRAGSRKPLACRVGFLIAALAAAAPGHVAAEPRAPGTTAGVALVLVPQGAAPADGVSPERLVAALAAQLAPYGMAAARQPWQSPELLRQQLAEAGRLGRARQARAAVWYRALGAGGERELLLRVFDLVGDDLATHRLKVGPQAEGLERSMAMALRTILRARLALRLLPAADPAAQPGPPSEPAPDATRPQPAIPSSPGAAGPPASRPTVVRAAPRPAVRRTAVAPPAARSAGALPARAGARTPRAATATRRRAGRGVAVGVAYALDSFPVGGALRHGPLLSATYWPWARIGLRAAVRVGFFAAGERDDLAWTRHHVAFCGGLVGRVPLGGRFAFRAGGEVCPGAVIARVRREADGLVEGATMWELDLGVLGGASIRLSRHLAVDALGRLAWVPVEHRLQVGGRDAGRSGGVALGVAAGLRIDLW